MNEVLDGILNELKFFGIKEALNYRMSEAMQSGQGHQDFLTNLLEDEKLYRRNKHFETLRKRAKFRDKVFLDEFEVKVERAITKTMLQQLKSLYFVENNENLIFIGGTGAGKSFLAQALGHNLCMSGVECLFISANKLFKEIEAAEAQGGYLNYIARLGPKVKVLIIDDLGLRNYTHKEATVLYEILEDRYRKGPIIITSQVRPQGWKALFEDQVLAEAILDRITACAHIIEVKGPSYRGNHKAKNKMDQEKK